MYTEKFSKALIFNFITFLVIITFPVLKVTAQPVHF